MPPITQRGTSAPQLQERTVRFDPQRGKIIQEIWKGIDQNQIEAKGYTYEAAGIAYECKYNQGGTGTLNIDDSTQSNPIDKWEMVPTNESMDAFNHPKLRGILGNNYQAIAALRNGLQLGSPWFVDSVEDPETGLFGDESGVSTGPEFSGLNAVDLATVGRFYNQSLQGATDYRVHYWVLRHTTNVPNRWSILNNWNVADKGVDTIYTAAQLLTEVTDPALWTFPLPPRLQYLVNFISNAGFLGGNSPDIPAPDPDYIFGWLKSASSETVGANNRDDIITEYTLAQFSTDKYQPYQP